MRNPLPSLTLVVPVLNEEILLPDFLAKTANDLEQGRLDWELILVNDGSTDRSLSIMQAFAAGRERVKVIDLAHNMGPGANLYQAYSIATKDFITYGTVDGFYDTQVLPMLMAQLHDCDSISAYRLDLGAHPPLRRVQTLANVYLQRLLFPPRFRFTAYHTLQIHRRDFLQKVRLESKTPFMCSEMLFKAVDMGLTVKEVGIPYLPRKAGQATGGNPKLIKRHLKDLFHYWFQWFVLGKPLVDGQLHLESRRTARAASAREDMALAARG